jgi:hypothetical protein
METNAHPMTESLESWVQTVSEEPKRTHLESTNKNLPMAGEVVGTSSDMGQSQSSEEPAKTRHQRKDGDAPRIMEIAEISTDEALAPCDLESEKNENLVCRCYQGEMSITCKQQ